MKIWRFGVLILLYFSIFSASWAQEHEGPRIFLKEKSFIFGDVNEGEVIEHTFKVFNKGDKTLEIKKVTPG